jgi:uncharacterized protein YqeY
VTIQERLRDDLYTAMRGHDAVAKTAIRMVRAAVQNKEKEKGEEVSEEATVEILARMMRQYRESIDTFRQAGRDDLVDKEEAELAVVMRYLPEQLGTDEVLALAKQAVTEVGASGPGDRGKVMGKLMPQLRGKADGSVVNTVVSELLDSLT